MAGGEIYRVEIPIIIDDQTDKPLQQAEQKVSRFEKSAQKTNERIRRIFGREISLKIGAIDKAWPVIRSIQTRLRGITGKAWKVTLEVKDKVTGFIKGLVNKLTSPLALLGAGAGVGAGIIFPLKLAGEFEQAQMSLDFYMGSVEEGKKAFEDLVRFAKETPFEFPFLQGATIQLMGAGYNFEQAKRALLAFGDAAGRTGAGMQGIEAALLGFTQIASAGTLNLQDLKQVALNLKLPLNIFAKELGVAESELGNIGSAGISSAKAMEAIVRTLEQRFAGGMKELSNSLLGMTAVIKDTANLTVWHFGKGMAGPVKRILMDIIGLTEDTGGAFEEFQRRLERAGERVGRKFEEMYRGAKQFFRDLVNMPGWNEMTWSEKVTVALNKILESANTWLEGPGGETIKETGRTLGTFLKTGMEEVIPEITPVAIELGKTLAGAVVQGIYEVIKANPWAGILLGAYVGFRIAGPKGAAVGIGAAALAWGLPKGFEALGKHIPGTEYYIRERIAEYERAEQMLEERKAVTPPGEPLFPGTELRAMPKRAIGGIFSRPHTALVAEAGPEAIIPLTSRMRSRALGLWEEAGRRLGVRPYAEGGLVGTMTEGWREKIPVSSVPSLAMPGPATINLNFDLTGLVRQVVIENREDIDGAVDRITDAIANNLREVFQNMTK